MGGNSEFLILNYEICLLFTYLMMYRREMQRRVASDQWQNQAEAKGGNAGRARSFAAAQDHSAVSREALESLGGTARMPCHFPRVTHYKSSDR